MVIVNCRLPYMMFSWVRLGTSDESSFGILSPSTPCSLGNYLPFSSWRKYRMFSASWSCGGRRVGLGTECFNFIKSMVIYSPCFKSLFSFTWAEILSFTLSRIQNLLFFFWSVREANTQLCRVEERESGSKCFSNKHFINSPSFLILPSPL